MQYTVKTRFKEPVFFSHADAGSNLKGDVMISGWLALKLVPKVSALYLRDFFSRTNGTYTESKTRSCKEKIYSDIKQVTPEFLLFE